MADERVEVTCHGCGHAFPIAPARRARVSECPSCGGWIDVAADAPEPGRGDGRGPETGVGHFEFEQAQRGGRRVARGEGPDSCGA